MDPIPPLPNKPAGPPPPKVGLSDIEAIDAAFYGGGATAVIITQIFGKSYPKLAVEVWSNAIGGGHVNFAKREFRPSANAIGLLTLPAPFGYYPPELYGFEPNYLNYVNKFLTFEVGTPTWFGLPESSILKTLPDTHPEVKAAKWRIEAKEQTKAVTNWARTASSDDILKVYEFASTDRAKFVFFDPERTRTDLQVSLSSKIGYEKAYRLTQSASLQSVLPPPGLAGSIPSPSGTQGSISSTDVIQAQVGIYAKGDPPPVIPPLPNKAPLPLDTPPAFIFQQEAAKAANDVVKNLFSERADP